jgi:hypothetical protein
MGLCRSERPWGSYIFAMNYETIYFMLGNVVLVIALVILMNFGALWDFMGAAAMGLWIAVTGLGAWLVMKKDGPS